MCLNLLTIPNPHYGKRAFASQHGGLVEVPRSLRPNSPTLQVPCGKCAECKTQKYNAILQRSIMESMTSYLFFITLTYDNEHVWSIKLPDGRVVYYANYDDITHLFKRLRNYNILGNREFRYLCVNEYGDTTNRPHWHIIMYVARMEDDQPYTPEVIQKTLFDNIKKYYAKNIGTRKEPNYEPLFTYHRHYNALRKRYEDNYRVEYVKPTTPLERVQKFLSTPEDIIEPDVTTVKTTRYLTGYVAKPNDFGESLEAYIETFKNDTLKYQQIRRRLKCQCRFSKGFGNGFTNGKKSPFPMICVSASTNAIFYSDLMKCLPKTYYEFQELYPDQAEELEKFRKYNVYRRYRKLRWSQCIKHMTTDQYMYHCMYIKYFKKEFSQRYKNYFKRDKNTEPTVSYYYNYPHRNYYYAPPTVSTTTPIDSPLYRYLRKGVEEGIKAGVPFLAFKIPGTQKFTALCKYYRQRICTVQDTQRMYDACGAKNYEEWQQLFIKQRSTRKSNLLEGNQAKYYNEYKKIVQPSCKSQKNCLSLHQLEGERLYLHMFSNYKGQKPFQRAL